MTYHLLLTRGAAEDVADAGDYYERQQPGLGDQFQREVDRLLDRLRMNPHIYAATPIAPYRKGQLRVFPYLVYYSIIADVVRVVAVEHASREPGRWLEHLRN